MTTNQPRPIRIAVLMATFNGASFIDEQVESILRQNGVDVRIFVSDDGSNDGTLERLHRWPTETVRFLAPRQSGGAGQNFLRLLREVPWQSYDFVAFSDQDDIWHPDKLKRAVTFIRSKNLDAYSSNVTAFWPDGRRQLVKKAQPFRRLDYLFEAAGPGNTYVLPRATAQIVLDRVNAAPPEVLSRIALHDWLIYAVVRAHGLRWWIDPEPSLDYRQHAGNVLGAGNGWARIRRRIERLIGEWYRSQVCDIAMVAGVDGPEVDFLTTPQLRRLPQMLRHLRDFRRRPYEAMVLGPAMVLYAIKGRRI